MSKSSSPAFHVLIADSLLSTRHRRQFPRPMGQVGRLLARSADTPYQAADDLDVFEAWLASHLEPQTGKKFDQYPPWAMLVAANSEAQSVTSPAFTRFLGTPGHIAIERDGVSFTPAFDLKITPAESEAFWQVVKPIIEEAGWKASVNSLAEHALLVSDKPLPAELPSPQSLQGVRLTDYLPRSAEATAWRRLWMRLQVELHDSVFNKDREKAGLLPMNCLWFWGGGHEWPISQMPRFWWGSGQGIHEVLSRVESDSPILNKLMFWQSVLSQCGVVESENIRSSRVHVPEFQSWQAPGAGLAELQEELLGPMGAHGVPVDWHFLGLAGWKSLKSNWKQRALFWKTEPRWDLLIEPEPEGALTESHLQAAWQAGQEDQMRVQQQWGDLENAGVRDPIGDRRG